VLEAGIGEVRIRLIAEENVFAKGKLDLATKLLLENMEINEGDSVLDLGCGSGVIGIYVSKIKKNVKVTFVDNDYLSVETTKKNLVLNEVNNGEVFVSDGIEVVKNRTFSCVISNPPFHQGREVSHLAAERFIRDSYGILKTGGKMYVVCSAFLNYEKVFRQFFGDFTIVARNKSFKVILGFKK
jgi:16S rRNA (guanine1207-N2)-methyltransferase